MLSRRRFVFVGLAGVTALVATTLFVRSRSSSAIVRGPELVGGHRDMLSVLAISLLGSALSPQGAERDAELQRVLSATAALIDNLPPSTRSEISDLFSLLGTKPARALLGYSGDWAIADVPAVTEFLAGLRSSSIGLKQQAYFALHDLLLGSYYSDARAWAATGYPGPPKLS